ncbi:hypothetical protein FSARC_6160 [Fusarium sarcochroum]|uniref:Peptidase C14 caspase domain-containing protein n=1 Tax=Fusarium sarcochroum TaxID=1208366 RepID=A0A8H4X9M8_9HYPO|nr:hypothetical protein FSARC_6160 [Fusarium sarcochroum]
MVPLNATMSPDRIEYHAILIGINDYPDHPLSGCVRDVEDIKALLEQRPEPVNINILTALNHATNKVRDPRLCPTYGNVTAALRDVTNHSQPNDRVYIHFSGHGARSDPTSTFSNRSTGDLALVLHKHPNENTIEHLHGHRLAVALNAMVNKGLVVTLVLDCCFSASVYRKSRSKVRCLVSPVPACPSSISCTEEDVDSGYRGLSMRPSWLIDPKGYAILAACAPDEEAIETIRDGAIGGALSNILYLILKDIGFNERLGDVYHHVYAAFRKIKFPQRPALYGVRYQSSFGHRSLARMSAAIPASLDSGVLLLEAGAAHGVSNGDEFVLWRLTNRSAISNTSDNPASATVIDVQALTSKLSFEQRDVNETHSDWLAHPRTRQVLHQFPVRLTRGLSEINTWKDILVRHSLVFRLPEDDSSFIFEVVLVDNQYNILNNNHEEMQNLPYLQESLYRPEDVCAILHHLARYEAIRGLTNLTKNAEFQKSFEIWVSTPSGETFGPSSSIEVSEDQSSDFTFELNVKNKTDKHLFIHVFNLDPLWQIETIDCEDLPPKDMSKQFNGTFIKKLETEVPDELRTRGSRQCFDELMVIVTSQPTSFSLFELPQIGEILSHSQVNRGTKWPEGDSQDWEVSYFSICTSF